MCFRRCTRPTVGFRHHEEVNTQPSFFNVQKCPSIFHSSMEAVSLLPQQDGFKTRIDSIIHLQEVSSEKLIKSIQSKRNLMLLTLLQKEVLLKVLMKKSLQSPFLICFHSLIIYPRILLCCVTVQSLGTTIINLYYD